MGDRQLAVYLSIRNPFEGDYSNYDGIQGGTTDKAFTEIREALIRDGYDGIITREDGEIVEYAAFFPTQIKSVNNRGTFDADNPNILYQAASSTMEELYPEGGTTGGFTLAALRRPDFVKQRGKRVAVQALTQMIGKSDVKQADRAVMLEAMERFKDQKSILYDDFEKAVAEGLVPFERIETDEYADYGYDRLYGEDAEREDQYSGEDAGREGRYSVVLNMPNVNHGQKGHWGDVYGDRKDVGLFGHLRVWLDGDTAFIAEMQSDVFQHGKFDSASIKEAATEKARRDRDYGLKIIRDRMFDEVHKKRIAVGNNFSRLAGESNRRFDKRIDALKNELDKATADIEKARDREIEAVEAGIDRQRPQSNLDKEDIKARRRELSEPLREKYRRIRSERGLVTGNSAHYHALDELNRAYQKELGELVEKHGLLYPDDVNEKMARAKQEAYGVIKGIKDKYDKLLGEAKDKYNGAIEPIMEQKRDASKEIAGREREAQKALDAEERRLRNGEGVPAWATEREKIVEDAYRKEIALAETAKMSREGRLLEGFSGGFEDRLIREAVNEAALAGKDYAAFPTAETLSVIEGYSAIEGDEDLSKYEGVWGVTMMRLTSFRARRRRFRDDKNGASYSPSRDPRHGACGGRGKVKCLRGEGRYSFIEYAYIMNHFFCLACRA